MINRLLKNTGSNVLVLIVKIFITFIMTPVFLHNMGNYDYGIWEIIASIVGYMGLLDFGVKPALTRYTAKYIADDNKPALHTMYSSAIAFTVCMGIFLSLILIAWGMFFPETLASGNTDTSKYALVLFILAGQMLIMFPGYVPESYLEGFQHYHLKNNIVILNSILGAVVLYSFITPDNALYLLALINGIGISIKYLVYFLILSQQRYDNLIPEYHNISFKEIKHILTFGGKSFIQGVAYQIESLTDVLVIGYFLGPAIVPFYSIPANLIAYIRNVGFTITHVFMPQFSHLFAENNKQALVSLYINASKWVIFFMLGVTILAVFFGPSFITLWLGKEYGEKSQLILLLLATFTMIPFLDPFKTRYLTAINKHALLAKLFPLAAAINLIVSIVLVEPLGLIGVAIGSIVPVIFFMPIYLKYSCKQLGIPVLHYIKGAIFPVILPSSVLIISSFYTLKFYTIDNYFQLLLLSGMNFFIYLIIVVFVLNKNEKIMFKVKFLQWLDFIQKKISRS